jgi:GNAT superfamily N-acetyltransferase
LQIKTVEDAAEARRERITDILSAQAEAAGHPFRSEQIMLEAWDGDTYLGGLNARVGAEWIYVELLAVDEHARGRGVGRRLVETLEAEARRRGMLGLWLDTFTFQAPDFYRKLGFTEFGRIVDYPRGGARVFFAKRLDGR